MRFDTHIASSTAVGTGIALIANIPFTIGYVFGIVLGSVLPDIDHPESFIGRRSFGLSSIINKKFGHRGMTHSLILWLIFSIIVLILLNNLFGIGIVIGYLFHIIGDLFSISGVPLLKPYHSKVVKMPAYLTYKTFSGTETIIRFIFFVFILLLIPKVIDQHFFYSFKIFINNITRFIYKLISFLLGGIT